MQNTQRNEQYNKITRTKKKKRKKENDSQSKK